MSRWFLGVSLAAGWALVASGLEIFPTSAPTITAPSAVVIDARTGRELFAKNASEKRAVASTQKLLTALLILEGGDLDRPVVIEASDTEVEPSVAGIRAGEVYTRRDLLRTLLIKSANDVARALGRDAAGSEAAFAEQMNRRAKMLSAWSSDFKNPSGLTVEGQHSTARDMARIARAAYFQPLLRDIVRTPRMQFRRGDGAELAWVNTNRLLEKVSDCNGMKTGYTRASGMCLISSGVGSKREVIVVVLGSTREEVWKDSKSLLGWALTLP